MQSHKKSLPWATLGITAGKAKKGENKWLKKLANDYSVSTGKAPQGTHWLKPSTGTVGSACDEDKGSLKVWHRSDAKPNTVNPAQRRSEFVKKSQSGET